MTLKIYKQALLITLALTCITLKGIAQKASAAVGVAPVISISSSFDDKDFALGVAALAENIKKNVKCLSKSLVITVNGSKINASVNLDSLTTDFRSNVQAGANNNQDNIERSDDETQAEVRVKNYTKSYQLDANDRLKLNNQYGRIEVNTWERHEVKVDVEIKAEAGDSETAQKLLDGVTIHDGKNGDQVSFKTEIAQNNGNSWNLFSWGHNKTHKLTINYKVYMPAKTDLNVEDSYGAIVLPDLDGKVKITSSYGSVTAQNLNNPANEVDGSYGNMKANSINGSHIDYSYGNLDVNQCTSIHANMSYGSFKIGRLKGAADLNLSYVGGFKIGELASSFTRLNINSDYSSVALGIMPDDNFSFDVTTSYGGFNFNESKVTLTSKPSPDWRHYSSSKTYKGYIGKNGSDARVAIQTNYGSVNFE